MGHHRQSKGRVLIVDDVREVADVFAVYLEGEGYEVVTAYDGEVGLALVRSKSPDVVILNLKMPGRNGFEVLADLRDNPPERPPQVILASGACDRPVVCTMAMAMGAFATLNRPEPLAKLSAVVAQAFAARPRRDPPPRREAAFTWPAREFLSPRDRRLLEAKSIADLLRDGTPDAARSQEAALGEVSYLIEDWRSLRGWAHGSMHSRRLRKDPGYRAKIGWKGRVPVSDAILDCWSSWAN